MWIALLAVLALAVSAADPVVREARLIAGEDAHLLDADIDLELSTRLEDVVARGVPLYFVLEFELTRPRWYWFDETIANRRLTYRLSFHALTRQYRLSSGALHQNFATLDEAMGVITRLRGWPVADRGVLRNGTPYEAALRLSLDLTQLPKPLQVSAIGSREWNLGTDWTRWKYVPGEREPK